MIHGLITGSLTFMKSSALDLFNFLVKMPSIFSLIAKYIKPTRKHISVKKFDLKTQRYEHG